MGDGNTFEGDDLDTTGETGADTSPLGSLRARREKVLAGLHIDLDVPRYDPPIVVRFQPVPLTEIEAFNRRYAKEKNGSVLANAAVLAKACLGVMEYDPDGRVEVVDGVEVPLLVSLDPEDRDGVLQFGPRLAELLGRPMAKKAVHVVQALYATDGDITSTADKLAEFSGYTVQRTESEFEGN